MTTIIELSEQLEATSIEVKKALGLKPNVKNDTELTDKQIAVATRTLNAKEETGKGLIETVMEINQLLTQAPHAATIRLHLEGKNKTGYAWVDQTPTARSVRVKVREALMNLWQSGAYNYEQLAAQLRLQVKDIEALIDGDFRRQHEL